MGLPSGTSYFVPIVVNRAKIGETASNLLYQIDLSSKLVSDSVFKGYITTANNIAVYDVDLDSTRPRRVVLDLTNNKLLIYWDGAASTVIDKKFYICVGSGVSQANSASAFTNNRITNFWGVDEFSNGGTSIDYASSNNLSVVASASVGNVGKFGNSAKATSASAELTSAPVSYPSLTNLSISFLVKFNLDFTTLQIIQRRNTGTDLLMYQSANRFNIRFVATGTPEASFSTAGAILGQWYHILISYNGALSTNAGKVQIYINGVAQTLSFTGTIPSQLDNSVSVYKWFAASSGLVGELDDMIIVEGSTPATFVTSRYNMVFDTTFFTVDVGFNAAPASLPASAKAWIKIIIDKAQVSESADNFLYQYDLSSAMLNVNWRKNWNSAANILVFDKYSGVKPRKVIVDGNTNKLKVYFNGAISTFISREFYICTGLTINESDSVNAFLNNSDRFYSCNETVNGSTLTDETGSGNGALTGAVTLAQSGYFENSALFASTGYATIPSVIDNKSKLIFEGIFKVPNRLAAMYILDHRVDANTRVTCQTAGGVAYFDINVSGVGGSDVYFTLATAGINDNEWFHLAYVFDVSKTTRETRLKIYVNGVAISGVFTGQFNYNTPNISAQPTLLSTSSNSFAGNMDEVLIATNTKVVNNIIPRYKMLFTPSIFSSISGVLLPSNSKRHSIHTGVSVSI
jgi:hypothetical protein